MGWGCMRHVNDRSSAVERCHARDVLQVKDHKVEGLSCRPGFHSDVYAVGLTLHNLFLCPVVKVDKHKIIPSEVRCRTAASYSSSRPCVRRAFQQSALTSQVPCAQSCAFPLCLCVRVGAEGGGEGKGEQSSDLQHTQPALLAVLLRMSASDARARISAQGALDKLRELWKKEDIGQPQGARGGAASAGTRR
jgi:hypothetical protein